VACLLLTPLVLAMLSVVHAAQPVDEYTLKLALVYKLTKFVTWPAHVFHDATQPFNICVLGKNPFGKSLDALTARQVYGRPIRVQRLTSLDGRGVQCQVVFVARSEGRSVDAILTTSVGRPILTVSALDRFARRGGMVEVVRTDRRFGLRINLDAARTGGLRIAAPLLELAVIVDTTE
jgi:hypothetical protein